MLETKIKVVLADDHPVVLLGLIELIARDARFAVVGQATSSTQLVAAINEHAPDVVITDYHMPEASVYGDGLKLVGYLARHFPHIDIVVMTMIANLEVFARLRKLGASVIQKKHMLMNVQSTLDRLASPVSREQSADHCPSMVTAASAADVAQQRLSARELDVLRLYMAGLSFRSIGKDQRLSVKTVSAYKLSAMKKLSVVSDQELIGYCIRSRMFN
ncbi:response regulator transcription factor [Pseudomonas sp. 18058]|jgi:two-component system capsular synthesis response regulator RcsB|uniref:response regulator transcription factor n=1 Tax=unclassified Pseudomonas TaxID=196821 RepID=UPI0013587EAC|nr:response regulator transcription factor [Pseudomonas sp. 18058]